MKATQVLGNSQLFDIRNEYVFINRSSTKKDLFVQQMATKITSEKHFTVTDRRPGHLVLFKEKRPWKQLISSPGWDSS